MLEFIVLGQVPGTHLELNFTTVLFVWLAVLMISELSLRIWRLQRQVKPQVEALAVYFAVVTARRRRKRA
jgi:hypothetical protein